MHYEYYLLYSHIIFYCALHYKQKIYEPIRMRDITGMKAGDGVVEVNMKERQHYLLGRGLALSLTLDEEWLVVLVLP